MSLKTVWLISFNAFLTSGSKLLAVALTFQGGSFEHGSEIYWIWVLKRHVTFCWPPWECCENKKKINVSEVLWDQMSRKKGGMSPRIISHPSHPTYQNPISINPDPLLCKVSWIFGFSVFSVFWPYWTHIGPLWEVLHLVWRQIFAESTWKPIVYTPFWQSCLPISSTPFGP